MRLMFRLSAPTFGEIDIALSFRITTTSDPIAPRWFNASKDMPAVSAPSPMNYYLVAEDHGARRPGVRRFAAWLGDALGDD